MNFFSRSKTDHKLRSALALFRALNPLISRAFAKSVAMFTMPNFLTVARIPLALLFFDGSLLQRSAAVVLAALTDFLDGYWARRFCASSYLGMLIDPLVDKFFVFCCIAALLRDQTMGGFQAIAFLMRDILLIAFMGYALISGAWRHTPVRSLWWGKVFTTLQFAILLGITLFGSISSLAFWPFAALGSLFFLELTTPTQALALPQQKHFEKCATQHKTRTCLVDRASRSLSSRP